MREIPLTQGLVALVDDDDFEVLNKFKWVAARIKQTYYAVRNLPRENGKQTSMHRVILNTPDGMDTDHINGNGLDNRRENLRVVSHRGNAQNRHSKKSSQYPGICWNKQKMKWQASIRINGQKHHLGYYRVEIHAYESYRKACIGIGAECLS